jgi:hypothetical protein
MVPSFFFSEMVVSGGSLYSYLSPTIFAYRSAQRGLASCPFTQILPRFIENLAVDS